MADTTLTEAPVCPHCGHKHTGAWEWDFGPGLEGGSKGRECGACGELFDCEREVSVYYTTKAAARAGGGKHGA